MSRPTKPRFSRIDIPKTAEMEALIMRRAVDLFHHATNSNASLIEALSSVYIQGLMDGTEVTELRLKNVFSG